MSLRSAPRLRVVPPLGAIVLSGLAVLWTAACGEQGVVIDSPPPPPPSPPRTYAMGWAPTPPRPDIDAFFEVVDSITAVAEITILQQPVPWPELLAGAPLDSPASLDPPVSVVQTDILVYSGPAYIDLSDPLQPITHLSIFAEPDNIFAEFPDNISLVTVFVSDEYMNPVPAGSHAGGEQGGLDSRAMENPKRQ